jgi:hypothetical protein
MSSQSSLPFEILVHSHLAAFLLINVVTSLVALRLLEIESL